MPPVVVGLRRYRRFADLSQAELASRVGVSRYVIADLESHRSVPRLALARKIARTLDVPMDVLFPPEGQEVMS